MRIIFCSYRTFELLKANPDLENSRFFYLFQIDGSLDKDLTISRDY